MEPAQVLLVDDDVEHAETMVDALRDPATSAPWFTLRRRRWMSFVMAFDVVVTDLVMESETAGLDVLRLAQEHQPDATTIMVTTRRSCDAKAALQGGAYDFIEKPLDLDAFESRSAGRETSQLRQQNQGLKEDLDAVDHFHGIVGQSKDAKSSSQFGVSPLQTFRFDYR